MLALTVRAGDYITIGDDIVIQVLKVGDLCRVAIDAPRELSIEREKVHESIAGTPDCIQRVRKNSKNRARSARLHSEGAKKRAAADSETRF